MEKISKKAIERYRDIQLQRKQGRIHGHQFRTGGQGPKCAFSRFSARSPLRTDRPTDRRTDKASYRVACPPLKREKFSHEMLNVGPKLPHKTKIEILWRFYDHSEEKILSYTNTVAPHKISLSGRYQFVQLSLSSLLIKCSMIKNLLKN